MSRTHAISNARTLVGLAALAAAAHARGQADVRVHHQDGQTFVVWRTTGAAQPLTYDIYRFDGALPAPTDIAQGTLCGRVLEPEWSAARLRIFSPALTWRVPTPAGPASIAAIDGLFVYTPHAGATEWFAVVRHGDTAVTNANRSLAPLAQNYDPVNDPVTCHPQFQGLSPEGHPVRIFALWADGNDNESSARPDVPLMGNTSGMGVPHVFAIWEPIAGPGPGPYPAVFYMHGGDGSYNQMRPGNPAYANIGTQVSAGITVTHDGVFYMVSDPLGTVLPGSTGWLGYCSQYSRLDPPPAATPPTEVIIPYSIRRVDWITDWVIRRSGYAVDPQRVALCGYSGGSQGATLNARAHPERYSAWYSFCQNLDRGGVPSSNPPLGTFNPPVVWPAPGGVTLTRDDMFTPETRLSATERDVPFARFWIGRHESVIPWTPQRIAHYAALNDAAWGAQLYWDSRDHGVNEWSVAPWIGEWIVPVRTGLGTAHSATRFRRDQSFPAFFSADLDPALAGRQPDIGNGNPAVGDPYGTWGGYADWDQSTILDLPERWECTVWLTGLSAIAIDNCPVAAATTDLAVRRPQAFSPAPGVPILWRSANAATNATLQTGAGEVLADGAIALRGLTISRDPARRRITFLACYANCDGSSTAPVLNVNDFVCFQQRFAAGDPYANCDASTAIPTLNVNDFICFQQRFAAGCP